MRILHLVRHAQAETTSNNSKDFFRALTSSGMMDAARMARNMLNDGVKPDIIISSMAERAMRTAETFADQLKFSSEEIHYDEELYEGRLLEYLAILNNIDNNKKEAMLFGHNPIISFMAEYLTGDEIGEIPTSGVVTMSFENLDWNEIVKKSGHLVKYESPNKTFGF